MYRQLLEKMHDLNPIYALLTVNPFLLISEDPRVPQVNPEPTVTFSKHDSLAIDIPEKGSMFVFGNHCTPAYAATVFTGPKTNALIAALESDGLTFSPRRLLDGSQLAAYKLEKNSGVIEFTGTEIKAVAKVVDSIKISELSPKLRMVAGGTRINKITVSDNESAILSVNNAPKGFNFNSSTVNTVMEEGHKNWAKAYTAGSAAGPILGAIYRPQDMFDTNGFNSAHHPLH